jgi:hypothetical protein
MGEGQDGCQSSYDYNSIGGCPQGERQEVGKEDAGEKGWGQEERCQEN